MKNILILGAGSAGTMMVNHLNKKINKKEWNIIVVDQDKKHYYQPGFLFLPFDIYNEKDVVKEKKSFIPKGIDYVQDEIEQIHADLNFVVLKSGEKITYDILIIATGTNIVPGEIDGLEEVLGKNVFEFYTFEGAIALRDKLQSWEGGKLAVHIAEMPIKCPVAPLEFIFLADWFFKEKKNIRDKVELIYVTPLDSAFTKPNAAKTLGRLFEEKNIQMVTNFNVSHIEGIDKQLVSLDGKKVDYDLLVTIPTNMGNEVIERSRIGDELNFVPTDKHTLQSKEFENVFVIGDATNLPSSKAGSVAHFQAEILTENILSFINNKPLEAKFDGHANCYIESGYNKALLIDFNYETEPVEGTFPLPIIGPFQLLKETKMNHLGKMAFKHIYWNMLLKGIPIPTVTPNMKKTGKKL